MQFGWGAHEPASPRPPFLVARTPTRFRLNNAPRPPPHTPLLPPAPAADQLLANKRNRGLLEPYEEREAAAVGYMRLINPGAAVVAGPLTDPKVGGGGKRRMGRWEVGGVAQESVSPAGLPAVRLRWPACPLSLLPPGAPAVRRRPRV